jgi:hypothetical protein
VHHKGGTVVLLRLRHPDGCPPLPDKQRSPRQRKGGRLSVEGTRSPPNWDLTNKTVSTSSSARGAGLGWRHRLCPSAAYAKPLGLNDEEADGTSDLAQLTERLEGVNEALRQRKR